MIKREKFRMVGMVSAAIVLAAIGFTIWYAYHSSQLAEQTLSSANKVSKDVPNLPAVDSFETCKKSPGSKLLLTSPEQCITTTGKKFTDGGQSNAYLVITEWHVRLPLAKADLDDAQYTYNASTGLVHITTKTLASKVGALSGCKSGLNNLYLTRSKTEPELENRWGDKKIGSYYYSQAIVTEPDCVAQLTTAQSASISAIEDDLLSALPGLIAAP
ncbi:MAG TPA: hypothetical protein VLF40_01035 [Candidatus Saccharimonadales bacterium]|nr:hypothetical protein [Candidatus Saccharimonadales bacterium]